MYTEQNSTSWTFVYLFSIIPYYFFLKRLNNKINIKACFLKKKKQILKKCSKKELRDSIWVFYVCAVAKINQTYITQPSRKKPK